VEPSDAVNAGMAKQTEGRRLASRSSPPSVSTLAWLGLAWLGLAWLGLAWLEPRCTLYIVAYEDGTECSETLAFKYRCRESPIRKRII
jgi:hypothetical protein